MSELTGRRILVTGAGKGIGRATVCLLAGKGARVIAVARTRADLESLAAETGCETVEADLADADAVDGLIARAEAGELGEDDARGREDGERAQGAFARGDLVRVDGFEG